MGTENYGIIYKENLPWINEKQAHMSMPVEFRETHQSAGKPNDPALQTQKPKEL